jgi:YesN/AraC family two-component response regulator
VEGGVAKGSVLLVDDEPMSRRLTSSYLEKHFTVTCAPSGRAARASLSTSRSDIVILEYRLPDCSGLDLIRRLRSEHAALPIVMLTRHGSEQVCATAFRLGAHDYLSKPVGEAELVATIRRVLPAPTSKAGTPAKGRAADLPECSDPRVKEVARHIHEHYAKPLSVGELARKVGLSRSALSRKFTACFGTSIRTYIAQVRMAHAIDLLGRPGLSITEIAHEAGFYDLPRFDKVFRRIVGIPPTAYRRRAEAQKGKSSNT